MARRSFLGTVVATSLYSSISNTDTSITLLDGSTFPTGTKGLFVIVVDKNQLSEEKMLISSRSGNILTVFERGYDGTLSSSHMTGATVDHVLDATTIQEISDTTYDNEINYWMEVF